MGCAASKLDNEDTVRRCKERRRLMKDAVFARHNLAAAHADYCRSLRHTGSSLSVFAAGEHLSVSEQTPPVLLQPSNHPPSKPAAAVKPPPPPPPAFSPSPTIASSKLPHILSASSVKSAAAPAPPKRRNLRTGKPKLPHILSESSSPTGSLKSGAGYGYPTAFQAESTYSSTPSQASSMWNWENFYPPSPPGSDFFDRKALARAQAQSGAHHHLDPDSDEEGDRSEADVETETETHTRTPRSEYDFFRPEPDGRSGYSSFSSKTAGGGGVHKSKKMAEEEVEETEREEVQCSEWGDRYSSTTSSSSDEDDRAKEPGPRPRSEAAEAPSHFARSMSSTSSFKQAPAEYPRKPEAEEDAYSRRSMEISPETRMVVRHRDLKEIVDAIQKNFDDAASAGDQVSDMLEVGRAQLDRSFRQLKKTVYHSSSMLSTLSSSWTSKPPLAVKYRLDTEPGGGPSSLCSTLERLLAWEKKLYQEVKAREGVKIEHEKKLSTLQSQEYKGEDEAKLDKTKTSITRLQSLIIVTSQAVSTTSTAIVGLRDSDLVPQLVELCHGLMYMWRSMHQYHEVQNNIVQQVRGLVSQSTMGDSTSELHRQATRDLESAVSAWHSSFCRLIKFQRDFIRSVQAWFKLTLLPVSTDNARGKADSSEAYNFFDEWKLALDRVPDTVASEAIKSFINVVHVISAKQSEELKIKKRTETVSKELEKKSSSVRNIERKFYQSYSMVGIGLPDSGPDNGHALDARDPLAEKKSELAACQRRVEDELLRHAKAVEVTRAMTLNHLQTGLPGVFQALTNFSSLFTEALGLVCTHSYAIK